MATFVLAPFYFHEASIAESKEHSLEAAVEQWYAEYRDLIHSTALRVLRNVDDAEDVVQTVFLRMVRNDTRPDAGRVGPAYFRRAAKNAAIDVLRKRRQLAEFELKESHPAPGERAVERLHVRRAVERLSTNSAALLEMHSHGFQYDEMAERFGIEIGTVKSRMHRIRATLQKELQAA
jgi:RNA polymerase sigma-70 factor (ECF subfamily)